MFLKTIFRSRSKSHFQSTFVTCLIQQKRPEIIYLELGGEPDKQWECAGAARHDQIPGAQGGGEQAEAGRKSERDRDIYSAKCYGRWDRKEKCW